MKKIYSIIFLLALFFAKSTVAQNTCSTPYPYITGATDTYTITGGFTPMDPTNDYGCWSGGGSSYGDVTWIYLGICTSGSIDIELVGTGTPSFDVDFVAWGPLPAATTCGLDSSQVIDCSVSTSSTETVNIPSAVAGEYYKIMVGNYSGASGSFTINQIGGTGVACISTIYACPGTIPPQQICHVSTDAVSNHNIIIWNKDTTYTGDFIIQRETTTMGIYSSLDTVLYTDTSAYEDMVSNPMIQSFKYRILRLDSCGTGMVTYGGVHKTIHLLSSISSSTGYPQLIWNPYAGFSYGTYFIFRGSSPSTLTLYDSISASFTSYTDVAAVSGMNYYAVSVIPPSPCTPSHAMLDFALSNVAPAMFTGIAEASFPGLNIYPNPANEVLNIAFGNNALDAEVKLIDLTGRIVISKIFSNETHASIPLAEIANGSYTVVLSSEKGSIHRNIVVVR